MVLAVLLVLGVVVGGLAVWLAGSSGDTRPVAVGAAVGDSRGTPADWRPEPTRNDPLYEDLKFREMFGLSTDRRHIEDVRQGWDDEAGDAMLVPVAVDGDELEQVRTKMDLSAEFTAVAPEIEAVAGEGFAGTEIDLSRDQVIVRFQAGSVELESPEFQEQVRDMLPSELPVEFVEADFTSDELAGYSQLINDARDWLTDQGVEIALHGVNQPLNRVTVHVRSDPPAEDAFAEVVPLDALDIIYSDVCVVRGSADLGWEGWLACHDRQGS